MNTQHGCPWIQPSAIRLSWVPWSRTLNVNRGVQGGVAGGPLFSPEFTRLPKSWFLSSHGPLLQSVGGWLVDPHCQGTGCPSRPCSDGWLALAGAPVISRNLAGGPAATLAASNFKAWFKASFRIRSPCVKRCCFTSQSRTLMKELAVSVWIKATGSPTKAQCASCSAVAANSCSVLPLACTLALSCDQ